MEQSIILAASYPAAMMLSIWRTFMLWQSALLASLPLAILALAVPAVRATAADEPEHPVQFRIKLESVALKEVVGRKKPSFPEAAELRRSGLVTGEATVALRTATAAQIAAGLAVAESNMTIAVLDGTKAELRQGDRATGPGWIGTFAPRLVDGKASLELTLCYGTLEGKVFTGQTFDEKLVLPENGRLALRFAPTKDSPRERIIHIEVTHDKP